MALNWWQQPFVDTFFMLSPFRYLHILGLCLCLQPALPLMTIYHVGGPVKCPPPLRTSPSSAHPQNQNQTSLSRKLLLLGMPGHVMLLLPTGAPWSSHWRVCTCINHRFRCLDIWALADAGGTVPSRTSQFLERGSNFSSSPSPYTNQ